MASGYVVTIADIVGDVRRVAKELGHQPSVSEYAKFGKYSPVTLWKKIGGWREVVERCGLVYKRPRRGEHTLDEIEAEVVRVVAKFGRLPTQEEWNDTASIWAATLHRRCPSLKWTESLKYFLGANASEVKPKDIQRKPRGFVEESFASLRILARELGRPPKVRDAARIGIYKATLCRALNVTGWLDILKLAGVSGLGARYSIRTKAMSDDEVLKDVLQTARRLGRMPTHREQRRMGRVCLQTAQARVGGCANLEAFITERLGKVAPREMSHVPDPVRDHLKSASVDAIKDFFQQRTGTDG